MKNKKKYSTWLRNPYTGEEIEITATTEQALHNKCEKQYKSWDKEEEEWKREQYVDMNYQRVRNMDIENRRIKHDLQYHMLSRINKWTSYRFYESMKKRDHYSDRFPVPTLKEVKKDLKVPLKIGVLEYFSEKRKNKRISLEIKAQQVYEKQIKQYNDRSIAYENKNKEYNAAVEKKREAFVSGEPQEIIDFFSWVIEKDCKGIDGYYIGIHLDKNIYYFLKDKTLAVDLELPGSMEISDIEEYKYEEKRNAIKKVRMNQSEFRSLYTHVICDIVLRVICVLYQSDEYKHINSIIINGYRVFLDRSRGKYINDCVLSLRFQRQEYEDLGYLRNVDGEAVVRRVGNNIPSDFMKNTIKSQPIYDSGSLNVYYT